MIPGFYFYKVLIRFAEPLLPLPRDTLSEPVDPGVLRFFITLLLLLLLLTLPAPYNVDDENEPCDNIIGGSSTKTMIL